MDRLKKWIGLSHHSSFVKEYIDVSNMKAIFCMCSFVIFVEIWMMLRIVGIVLFSIEQRTTEWIVTHLCSYIVLLVASLLMITLATRYMRGKRIAHKRLMLLMSVYTLVCIGFGMYISYMDYLKGEQILSFLTMILFAACLVVWRPYVSFGILTASFGIFYIICNIASPTTVATDINLFTTYIATLMISVGNYNQRLCEARKEQELEEISTHDDLTGIPNMRHFMKRAEYMLKNAFEHGRTLTFLYFDIENFKTYNERYGFVRGNELLVRLATYIRGEYSMGETARLSDDHFVVLVDEEEPQNRIATIQERLKELEGDTYLMLRVGIYRTDGMKKDGSAPEDINLLCDRARFAASSIKHAAVDVSYCVYDEILHEKQRRKRYIISHLDSAVVEGHIQVYYQPIIDATSGKVCSLEALARWKDPVYGLLSPGEFIEALEEFRLIHKLDRYVIDLVCGDIRDELKNHDRSLPVSINLSRLDFELCDIADIIIETVGNIPKEYLIIEITESALNKNRNELKKSLDRLKNAGFNVWLDDFGSGYSSLNVLKDFDFDVLKIDMRFLEDFGNSDNLKPIMETIIRLCDDLNMQSLAEGVETKEEYEFLNEIGCNRVQGFLFSKPVTRNEFKTMVANGTLSIK